MDLDLIYLKDDKNEYSIDDISKMVELPENLMLMYDDIEVDIIETKLQLKEWLNCFEETQLMDVSDFIAVKAIKYYGCSQYGYDVYSYSKLVDEQEDLFREAFGISDNKMFDTLMMFVDWEGLTDHYISHNVYMDEYDGIYLEKR
jgi:hypothetical protein